MVTFIAIIHILIALFLIFMVLIQDSKGAMGGILGGGGSQSLFGASGAANVLAKATRYIAIVFAGTCLWLSWYSTQQTSSVIDGYTASETTQDQLKKDAEKSKDTTNIEQENKTQSKESDAPTNPQSETN